MNQFSINSQTDSIQTSPNREYRDRLFKAIFGRNSDQSKRWRLDLYNALNVTSYTDPDSLEVNTIENVIYMTMRNDISFLVDSQMTLYEQQSTHNPNMPLRGLFYLSQLYQMYIEKNDMNILTSILVKIPEPRFVVFYNGSTKKPDTFKMRLSDAFEKRRDGDGGDLAAVAMDFEWTATVININPGHNSALQKNCKPLYDYVRYVGRITDNKKKGLPIKEAVDDAVNWAIEENLLDGFFRVNKAEVSAMCLTEYDEEATMRAFRREGFDEGMAAGLVEGERQKAVETARKLIKKGIDPDVIAECTGLSLDEVQLFAEELIATQA